MPIPVDEAMVDTIESTAHWNSATITYAIGLDGSGSNNQGAAQTDFGAPPTFQTVSQADHTALEEAVALWDELIPQSLQEVSGPSADITVDQAANLPAYEGGVTFPVYHTAYSTTFNDYPLVSAGVYLEPNPLTIGGDYDWQSAVHELGHSLGLEHPGNYNAGTTQPTYAANRTYDEDTGLFSIMSYFEPSNYDPTINWTRKFILTPMIYDILAMQQAYGVDTTTRTGDTTYGFNTKLSDFANAEEQSIFTFQATDYGGTSFTTHPHVFTIWDAGGDHDRIDASGFTADQRIDLTPGSYSDIGEIPVADPANPGYFKAGTLIDSVGIAFGTIIEEAIGGSGNDTITGNGADNYLVGGAGDDVIHGGYGNDILIGGDNDDFLYGESGSDTLIGGDGNDYLDGGGTLDGLGNVIGPDTLTGGDGIDTFVYSTHYRTTIVTDYDPNTDFLDFTNYKSVHSFYDVLNYASQVGADTIIDFGDPYTPGGPTDKLTLQNVSLGDLNGANMLFSEETTNPVPPNFTTIPFNVYGNYASVQTAPLADGGYVAVESGRYVDIIAHRFDATGVETGTFQVNQGSLPYGALPIDTVALVGGGFAVVWESGFASPAGIARDPATTPSPTIYARFYDANGNAVSGDVVVNRTAALPLYENLSSSQQHVFVGYELNLTFAGASTSGGLIVQWRTQFDSDITYTSDYELVQQVFSPSGGYADGEAINPSRTLTRNTQTYILLNGDILNFWDTTLADGNTGLYAQVYGKSAAVLLSEFSESGAYAGYVSTSQTVSELADGRIEISWTQGGSYGYDISSTSEQTVIFNDHTLLGFTKPGTSGDDVLRGGPGNDRLYGLAGNDTLIGGLGADLLDGGDGIDTADYSRSLEAVNVDLERAVQQGGHAEGDQLVSIENVTGSNYDDSLSGDDGANVLLGGYGDDTLDGRGGNDTLDGGRGNDMLTGGAGADKFVYKAHYGVDTITDFSDADGDTVDVSSLGLTTFVSIKALLSQATEGAVLTIDASDKLIFEGIDATTLTATDFGLPGVLTLSAAALVARLPTLDPALVLEIDITGADTTLPLTAADVALYASLLAKIATPYSISVSDTAADVAANIDALSANSHVTAITLTDSGTPTLTVTISQYYADAAILAAITNVAYRIKAADPTNGYSLVAAYNAAGHTVTSFDPSGHRIEQDTYNAAGIEKTERTWNGAGSLTSITQYADDGSYLSYIGYYPGTSVVYERYTTHIVGEPFDASTLFYSDTGVLTLKDLYKNGLPTYSYQFNPDTGSTTTTNYQSGSPTRQVTKNSDASSDIRTWNASGSIDIQYDPQGEVVGRIHYDTDSDITSSDTYYPGTTDLKTHYASGITGQNYYAIARTYDPGSVMATQSLYNDDGTYTQTAYGNGRTLTSNDYAADRMQSTGTNETFVFSRTMGHDTLTKFVGAGAAHDTLQFDASTFGTGEANVGWLLAHASAPTANSVLLTFDADNSIMLQGISLATLNGNRHDISFVTPSTI